MADVLDDKFERDFFRKIFDSLYEGVYICDHARKITYRNKAAEKITGYSAQEVVGSHCRKNILNHTEANGNPLCPSEACPAVRQ
ncbi:MAG: PAS domain-containing protein [Spirochaetia bacterium]|nr:PAS domain-containing protein [Spirochaetia bacterium]